jgi:hypothetical protein
MQCPVDGEVLAISNRESIEIDYCPKCRGVWLDRGELDKIIERSVDDFAAPPSRDDDRGRDRDYDRDRDRRDSYKPKHKKKSSFLSQIMENLGE